MKDYKFVHQGNYESVVKIFNLTSSKQQQKDSGIYMF